MRRGERARAQGSDEERRGEERGAVRCGAVRHGKGTPRRREREREIEQRRDEGRRGTTRESGRLLGRATGGEREEAALGARRVCVRV
jgi:hypothetical protein